MRDWFRSGERNICGVHELFILQSFVGLDRPNSPIAEMLVKVRRAAFNVRALCAHLIVAFELDDLAAMMTDLKKPAGRSCRHGVE
jgi:hypothetical protein